MPPLIALRIERTEVTQREHNRITRVCLHAVAQNHLAFVVPKHFQINPSTRPGGPYGYAKRSRKYEEQKRRKFGHSLPLVYTGNAMASVLGGSRITATQDKVRLYLRPGHAIGEQQRAELEAMTPGELRQAVTLAHRLYANEVKNSDKRLKTSIVI